MLNLTKLFAAAGVLCAGAVALTTTGLVPAPFSFLQEEEKPTKHHEHMMKSVGEWEGVVALHGPMEGQKMEASETITAIGPFWTTSDFRAEFMGFPFSGRSVMGYDAKAKKAVGTWCDSSSSYLSVMEGTVDEETGDVEMRWDQPFMGGPMAPHRSVTHVEGDSYTSEFYVTIEGEEMHSMTIAMKRKKAAGK